MLQSLQNSHSPSLPFGVFLEVVVSFLSCSFAVHQINGIHQRGSIIMLQGRGFINLKAIRFL